MQSKWRPSAKNGYTQQSNQLIVKWIIFTLGRYHDVRVLQFSKLLLQDRCVLGNWISASTKTVRRKEFCYKQNVRAHKVPPYLTDRTLGAHSGKKRRSDAHLQIPLNNTRYCTAGRNTTDEWRITRWSFRHQINWFENNPFLWCTPGVGNCFGSGATLWKRRLAEGRTF
jgi:hypothetical protein